MTGTASGDADDGVAVVAGSTTAGVTAAGLDADQVRAWIERTAARAAAVADALDRLDAVAGDGDHGTAMARGWRAAVDALDRLDHDIDATETLRVAASAFGAASGGTAGALLGAALAAMASRPELPEALVAAVEVVVATGGASTGDKTLLDALAPAAAAAVRAASAGADAVVVTGAAADAALDGAEATVDLAARAGRARRVRGGGIGAVDPGARTVAGLVHTLAAVVAGVTEPPPVDDLVRSGAVDDAAHGPDAGPAARVVGATARPAKLLNDVADAVDEMIDGLVAAHPHRVARGVHPRIVVRAEPKPDGRVAVVIGNGSGHEPIAVGWVGTGLLDANACGELFAAPSGELLADAIVAADRGAGVLVLVSQHDGDVLCANDAVDRARRRGVRVEALPMYDDVATAPPERRHERRGAPGTTFLYKVLGAAAEEARSLDDLVALGRRLRDQTATLGLSLRAGTSPLTGAATHEVPPGTVVIGTGVHGEGGRGARAHVAVDDLVDHLLDRILGDIAPIAGEEVLVLVNGAGGTSLLELLVVHRAVDRRLRSEGLVPFRPLVGELVTTQEAAGIAVSVARTDPEIRRLWTAPCDAPYFPHPGLPPSVEGP